MPNDQISDLDATPPEQPDQVVPDAPAEARPEGFRWRRWMSWVAATAVVVVLVVIIGSAVRLPYYTISPGSAVNLLGDVSERSRASRSTARRRIRPTTRSCCSSFARARA